LGGNNLILKRNKTAKEIKTDFSGREKTRDILLRDAFRKIRIEMEEHLTSINENTNEIQSNYEYLCAIDAKVEKIAERLDELYLMFESRKAPRDLEIQSLTLREKEVFAAIYALSENSMPGYEDIARRTGLSAEMAQSYVHNLIAKGVPVLINGSGSSARISLDPYFRQAQAKENILRIDEEIALRIA